MKTNTFTSIVPTGNPETNSFNCGLSIPSPFQASVPAATLAIICQVAKENVIENNTLGLLAEQALL